MPTRSEVKAAAKTLAAARRDKEGITPDKKGSKKKLESEPEPKKTKKGWIIGLCAAVALAGVGIGTYFLVTNLNKSSDPSVAKVLYEKTDGGYKVTGITNEDKTKIKTLKIPNKHNGKPIVEIKEGALGGCANIEEISLPFIGRNADATGRDGLFGYVFGKEMYEGAGAYTWQCYSNKEEYIKDEKDDEMVYEQFVIPYSISTVNITGGNKISKGAFSMCKYIQEISIDNNATEIGNYAFYFCSSLFDFKIPSKVTSIHKRAFERDYVLQEITIPNTVATIKSEAFANCISLGIVRIPTSVTTIEKLTFGNLQTALIIVEAPTTPSTWDPEWAPETISISYGTENTVYAENVLVSLCKDDKGEKFAYLIQWTGEWQTSTIDIPDTIDVDGVVYPIRVVGPNIFESNTHLQFVTIGKNVEKIGASAFANCERLEVLNFVRDAKTFEDIQSNHALKYIGPNAFANDEDLYAYQINGDPISGVYIPDSVTEIGANAFYNCNHIARLNISESIVTIGDSAFENCERLMLGYYDDVQLENDYEGEFFPDAIRINNTIETIGEAAFKNCFRLQDDGATTILYPTVYIVDGANITAFNKHVFENCGVYTKSGIYSRQIRVNFDLGKHGDIEKTETGIQIFDDYCLNEAYMNRFRVRNENLKKVGDYAFCNARPNMPRLKVCHNVETIGERAFYNWTTVPEVELENNEDEHIGDPDYQSKLYSIGAYAFYNMNNTSLDKIYIPNGVNYIGNYAFYNCANVVDLHLPENPDYKDINFYTFASMKNLGKNGKTLEIPEGVVNVYRAAFQDCSSLTGVKFNNKDGATDPHIETVSWNIFANCRALRKVEWDLSYCTSFSSSVFANCQNLEEDGTATLGENTTKSLTLGTSTYSGATNLITANISSRVRTISTSAFEGCTNLTNITLSNRAVSLNLAIGKYAFRNCTNLTTFNMPSYVDSISDQAFANCYQLGVGNNEFHLPERGSLTIGNGIFSGLGSGKDTNQHTIGFYATSLKSGNKLYSKIKLLKKNATGDEYNVDTDDQTTLDYLGLDKNSAEKFTFKCIG